MPVVAPFVVATMRAITYDRYGTPDELRMTERPVPKVGPSEASG